jgi:hypothetical protein
MTIDQQEAKLAQVMTVAKDVWGSA